MNEEQRALLLDVVGRYERNEEVPSTEYMTAYKYGSWGHNAVRRVSKSFSDS